MTTYITSDLHLNHVKIVDYCPETRGHFDDHTHMTEWIISMWNDVVQPGDTVWILGDVSMGNPEHMANNLKRLSGIKHLVLGNHDKHIIKNPHLHEYFTTMQHQAKITVNDTLVVMEHAPKPQWDGIHSGSIFLHGHCHGSPSGIKGRIKDIGMDTNNMQLYVLDDVVESMLTVPIDANEDFRPRPDYDRHK